LKETIKRLGKIGRFKDFNFYIFFNLYNLLMPLFIFLNFCNLLIGVNMEFTKTQTSIIVLEIILIFCGIVAIFRAIKPKAAVDFSSAALVSTTTVSAVYLPPTDEIFKKIDEKKSISKSITIDLTSEKKSSKEKFDVTTIQLDENEPSLLDKKYEKKDAGTEIIIDEH